MDKIRVRQIQVFINTLSKDGANERSGKPLSPKTIRHILNLISDVFGYAVKMEVITENPCTKVTLPKIEQKEKQIYTSEEATHFLELLNDEFLSTVRSLIWQYTADFAAESCSVLNGKTLILKTMLSMFAVHRAILPTAAFIPIQPKLKCRRGR